MRGSTGLLTAAVVAALIVAAGATPAPAEEPSRSFTIAAVGDVIVHESIAAAARTPSGRFDFEPLLAPIEPWIAEADLAICHLEVPLSPTNTGLSYQEGQSHPALFNVPSETADALAAVGFDACSTAGNHALDAGFDGVVGTLEVLDDAGIAHSGTARNAEERFPTMVETAGVSVALVSYTIPTNVGGPGADRVWAVNVIDADAILADAAWARQRGAEFVIVSLHWGAEYEVIPTGWQRALAERLLGSPDVDVILGSHTHVVSPVERIAGKVVVYGMGNHLSNIRGLADGSKAGAEDGVIVHLTVVENGDRFVVDEVRYTTTWVDPVTKRVLPALHTLAREPGDLAWGLEAAVTRTEARISMLDPDLVRHTPEPWPALTCAGRPATLVGTRGRDVLIGTPGEDVIVGRAGDDAIWGMAGADILCGGDGDDVLHGGDGSDLLLGGPGSDAAGGDAGDDFLRGGPGGDLLGGDAGRDLLYGDDGDDLLRGGAGADRLVSGWGSDRLDGGPGHDISDGWRASVTFTGGGDGDVCRVAGTPVDCG